MNLYSVHLACAGGPRVTVNKRFMEMHETGAALTNV